MCGLEQLAEIKNNLKVKIQIAAIDEIRLNRDVFYNHYPAGERCFERLCAVCIDAILDIDEVWDKYLKQSEAAN